MSQKQKQTARCFCFKWKKRDTYESERVKKHLKEWLLKKYCGNDENILNSWFQGKNKVILDAGCGSGLSALVFFGPLLEKHSYIGADISQEAIFVAKERFKEAGLDAKFLVADVNKVPLQDGFVDIIFSEGVLHHTDDTRRALQAITGKLRVGGRIIFYVYKVKAPIREFTDDYIRNYFKDKTDGEVWEELKPLTKLGIELGKLHIDIDIPEDIPYLGIKKGKINLQRFFYNNYICKMFYRDDFSLEEMNHINFDWFHPLNCHRHSPEEVKNWLRELDLKVENFYVDEYGISVVAVKEKM